MKMVGISVFLATASLALAAHSDLEARYRAARQNIEKEAAGYYVEGLKAVENRFRAAGRPRELLAVRQERERFETDGDMAKGAGSEIEEVAERAEKIATWKNERLVALLKAYVPRLETMVADLTRANQLDEALAVDKRLESARLELAAYEAKLPKEEEVEPETPRGPVAGRNWTSPATGMEFVWIDEMEMWVGKYEVTNAEYRSKKPDHDSAQYRGQSMNEDRQPVVRVNFYDAKAYAEWLTRQDQAKLGGLSYRLPTSQEFIAAAQCGDDRRYPWGNEWPPPSGQAGNYSDNIEGYTSGFPVTAPVDELWANPWGLHGVGGNIWEATANPDGSFSGWRGAGWSTGRQGRLRCTSRATGGRTARNRFHGFRLVLSQPLPREDR